MKINKIMILGLALVCAGNAYTAADRNEKSTVWKGCKQLLAGSALLSMGFNISKRGHKLLACLPIYSAICFITKGYANVLGLDETLASLDHEQREMIFILTEERLSNKISRSHYDRCLKLILNQEIKTISELDYYLIYT